MCNTFQYSSFHRVYAFVRARSTMDARGRGWSPDSGRERERALICIRNHPVECGSTLSSSTACYSIFFPKESPKTSPSDEQSSHFGGILGLWLLPVGSTGFLANFCSRRACGHSRIVLR